MNKKSQYEQEVNVAYCEKFGNALALSPSKVSAQTLDKGIEILQTPEMYEKAEEMRELMRKTNGTKNAAEIIERQYLE